MKIIDVPLDSTFLLSLLTEAKQQNLILRTVDGLEFIVTGKQIGRASCRERVLRLV